MTEKKTRLTADPATQEIRVQRDFAAPRSLVFKAMTDPALIPQWWGATSMRVDQLEIRKGGIWRFVEDAEGGIESFSGVFHVIVPDELIVQTFEYEPLPGHHVLLETIRLEDHNGHTRLISTSVFQSIEDRDGMLAAGMEEGTEESYQRLEALLARLQ
jgi:uncharacterized protein YndB with AHSA1/START domain